MPDSALIITAVYIYALLTKTIDTALKRLKKALSVKQNLFYFYYNGIVLYITL